MRDFQAVFGAFGGGKGQGGGSPEDFRSFFRRFYGLIWVSQKKAARPVLKLRAAVAGAFAGLRPTAGCCMPWAKIVCLSMFKQKYLYMCLLLLTKEVTTSQWGHHCSANSF